MWHVRLVLKEYPCGIVVQTTREDLNQARCPDRERSDRRPLIRLLFFRVLILGEYMGGDVWAALEQQGDNLCLPVTLVGLHIKASHTGSASYIDAEAIAEAVQRPRMRLCRSRPRN
jgi:hypothetical protein